MTGQNEQRILDTDVDSNDSSRADAAYLPDLCHVDDIDSDCSSVASASSQHTLDPFEQCIDANTVTQLVQGRPTKKARIGYVDSRDKRPVAFIRFNTKRGKAKPVTIRALLDSGAAETLVCSKHTKKLKLKSIPGKSVSWSSPGGTLKTTSKVKAQFTIPELHEDKIIEWDVHVTEQLGAYDMIIGRDILEFLQIDIRFSDMAIHWDHATMPFKPYDAKIQEAFHVNEPDAVIDEMERVKRILDAKYVPADLDEVCSEQTHLLSAEIGKLSELLHKYADLFDGTLGSWKEAKVDIELKPDATPYHAKPYPIPKCHLDTLRMEVDRLCEIGVLKRVNRSQWAAPTFIIPKKDGTVRFISDFRELNKRIVRKPYPIPHIQDMLLNLEGFQHATSLDLNMGFYHIELNPASKALCTIVLPFGKYEYQRIPMGLCNSPDIFQEKMSELMDGLDFVRTYIDDLLCLTKGTYDDHLKKLERVFKRLQDAGLKVNAKKSFFARQELEYLGYWITRDGIKPLPKKVEAILKIATPTNRKELRSFIGVVNYYRDMWLRRSHVLAPLASLTSKTTKWKWGPQQQTAFDTAKRIIARETMLAYPDFSKPFQIHTDASHYQLGAVISQDNKPIAFYSRKLNSAQTRYTTTERELLSIVETLKEYRTILLGHRIEVFTDHKNLVYKHFNTERVMRWRLLIEEFGPQLTYIKGAHNVVADALSRLNLTEDEFSPDAFLADLLAADDEDLPESYPLSYKEIYLRQQEDEVLLEKVQDSPDVYSQKAFKHSDKSYDLWTKNDKIVLPQSMQRRATEWYHVHLLHPGQTRMELTIGQHYCWTGMRKTITTVCRACRVCKQAKHGHQKYGILPPKVPESIPWHTLCIDLIGPYTFGHGKNAVTLHCLTMIDPATGWFEICEIPNKQADVVVNFLEFTWLTRCPWPTEAVLDRGSEFKREVAAALRDECGVTKKLITTRNPQANAIVEHVHQVIGNMIRATEVQGQSDLDEYGWRGILAAVRQAVRSTVHTTTRATPTQLVFGRDAILNVSFEADWQYIKDRKQKRILQNNAAENATRIVHVYNVGDIVMVRQKPNRKFGEPLSKGPFTVTRVNDNGTLRLSKATPGGAVFQTWNIRNVFPCKA